MAMPDTFTYEIKIPKERVAVLIGKNGDTKKELEEHTGTKMDVDSDEGDVTISGEDAVSLFTLRELIRAIGRGFNPEIAKLLLKQDYLFDLISLKDFSKSTDHLLRIKGRIIGKEGKSRKTIEELTETYISVYGKTVGIIGTPENVDLCRRAIDSLLKGSPHANVYSWLEKRRSAMKRQEKLL
jgi:ribosomal RNA assembly protein